MIQDECFVTKIYEVWEIYEKLNYGKRKMIEGQLEDSGRELSKFYKYNPETVPIKKISRIHNPQKIKKTVYYYWVLIRHSNRESNLCCRCSSQKYVTDLEKKLQNICLCLLNQETIAFETSTDDGNFDVEVRIKDLKI